MAWELIEKFFMRQGVESKSRSTVLSTPMWFVIAIATIIVGLVHYGAPNWLLIVFVSLFAIGVFVIFGAFVFFAKNGPEFLRTEWHSIRRLEIERGIAGDSMAGTFDPTNDPPGPGISVSKTKQIGGPS